MTLLELSIQYADGAAAIHTRIRELEQLERIQTDPVCAQALRRPDFGTDPFVAGHAGNDPPHSTLLRQEALRWQLTLLIPAAANGWAT